jgi:hypothetical protein
MCGFRTPVYLGYSSVDTVLSLECIRDRRFFEPTLAFLQPFVTPTACKLAVYVTSSLAVRSSLVDTRKFGVESWGFS